MDSGQKINWKDDESFILLNPRLPKAELSQLQDLAQKFQQPGHIWIASSGSSASATNSSKLIALSKKAFLASAKAVNEHLQVSSKDIWIQTLPRFHVGGLSIEARGFLASNQIIKGLKDEKWDPDFYCQAVEGEQATLSALVATQVFDLVHAKKKAPLSLRAVVVGGSSLSQSLYESAMDLGWPLLPSYGMTECCSQIATASLISLRTRKPQLNLLSHIQAKISSDHYLMVKSASLLTGFAQLQNGIATWIDPKIDGWYQAQDLCELRNGVLTPLGRGSDFVKIKGEGVNLQKLQEILETESQRLVPDDWLSLALLVLPDERAQNQICLAYQGQNLTESDLKVLIEKFNQRVAPFERITASRRVTEIPRTALGKVAQGKLKETL